MIKRGARLEAAAGHETSDLDLAMEPEHRQAADSACLSLQLGFYARVFLGWRLGPSTPCRSHRNRQPRQSAPGSFSSLA